MLLAQAVAGALAGGAGTATISKPLSGLDVELCFVEWSASELQHAPEANQLCLRHWLGQQVCRILVRADFA